MTFECQQACHSVAISVVSPAQRPFLGMFELDAHPVCSAAFGGNRWWGWRVPDRGPDTLVPGLFCLVADMDPVRRIVYSEDRNLTTGLAFVWMSLRDSRTETLTASIPDPSQELTQQTPLDHFGVPPTSEDQIILSEAPRIHQRIDRVDHAASTQVRTLSTDHPLRHTHLQRVAFGLPVFRFGGVGC